MLAGTQATLASAVRVAQGPSVELGFSGIRTEVVSDVRRPWRWPIAINVAELVGLTAWPLGDTAHLPVPRVRARSLPPTALMLVSCQSSIDG